MKSEEVNALQEEIKDLKLLVASQQDDICNLKTMIDNQQTDMDNMRTTCNDFEYTYKQKIDNLNLRTLMENEGFDFYVNNYNDPPKVLMWNQEDSMLRLEPFTVDMLAKEKYGLQFQHGDKGKILTVADDCGNSKLTMDFVTLRDILDNEKKMANEYGTYADQETLRRDVHMQETAEALRRIHTLISKDYELPHDMISNMKDAKKEIDTVQVQVDNYQDATMRLIKLREDIIIFKEKLNNTIVNETHPAHEWSTEFKNFIENVENTLTGVI